MQELLDLFNFLNKDNELSNLVFYEKLERSIDSLIESMFDILIKWGRHQVLYDDLGKFASIGSCCPQDPTFYLYQLDNMECAVTQFGVVLQTVLEMKYYPRPMREDVLKKNESSFKFL